MDETNKTLIWILKNKKKRSREKESDSDSDMETRQRATRAGVDGAWPVYLVVREIEDGLRECTPFLLHRAIKGVSKGLCVHRKLKDGSYIIKSKSEKASSLLLKQDQKHLAGKFKISVSVHKTLNSSRGVVRCAELGNMSVEEIKEELADQGVTDVYRVKTKRAGKEIPTNTYFVTFATPKLPSVIRVGWLQVQVKVFVPSPMRCFNCQRLGHTSKACKSAQLCKCGKEYHDAAVACDSPAKCINCKGDHPSDSRNCPSWIEESNIQRLKAEQGISFAEAKKLAQQTSYVTPDRSFARVASESGTQIAGDQIAKLVQVVESLAERVMALERCVSLMAGVGHPNSHLSLHCPLCLRRRLNLHCRLKLRNRQRLLNRHCLLNLHQLLNPRPAHLVSPEIDQHRPGHRQQLRLPLRFQFSLEQTRLLLPGQVAQSGLPSLLTGHHIQKPLILFRGNLKWVVQGKGTTHTTASRRCQM